MPEIELKNMTLPEVNNWLITMPSIIAREEEKLSQAIYKLDEAQDNYEEDFSKAFTESEGTNEGVRKADASVQTIPLKREITRLKLEVNLQKTRYHSALNKNENIVELARNKRVEVKKGLEHDIKNEEYQR